MDTMNDNFGGGGKVNYAGSGLQSGFNVPTQHSAVSSSIEVLSKEIQINTELVTQLYSRLRTVLGEVPEKPQGDSMKEPSVDTLSSKLRILKNEIQSNNRKMDEILQRLEL